MQLLIQDLSAVLTEIELAVSVLYQHCVQVVET